MTTDEIKKVREVYYCLQSSLEISVFIRKRFVGCDATY